MDQCLLAADLHVDEAVGAVGFDGGLLGVNDAENFDIVLVEGEAGEVMGIGVDEMFGDGIEFGHESCLGLRVEWYPQPKARIVPQRWLSGEKGI